MTETNNVQHMLYRMEKERPSSSNRKLTLKERIQSLSLPFRTYKSNDGELYSTNSARKRFEEYGTFDTNLAYAIKCAKIDGSKVYHQPSPDEDCNSLSENIVNTRLVNDKSYIALAAYLSRGWEIPDELIRTYEESARTCLESLTFLLDNPEGLRKDNLDILEDTASIMYKRLSITHPDDYLTAIAKVLDTSQKQAA